MSSDAVSLTVGSDVSSTAIALLEEQGFEATTVDQLADAAGISRATFFRRFRSKDDVVFADHDALLARLDLRLRDASDDPLLAVAAAGRLVLEHHVALGGISQSRHRLLQANPVLRDRELVTSHRYERLFVAHLRRTAVVEPGREWAVTSFAAAVVAVHNQTLRSWLRGELSDPLAELDTRFAGLIAVHRPAFGGAADVPSQVIVAVYDTGTPRADVLRAVQRSLDARTA